MEQKGEKHLDKLFNSTTTSDNSDDESRYEMGNESYSKISCFVALSPNDSISSKLAFVRNLLEHIPFYISIISGYLLWLIEAYYKSLILLNFFFSYPS